MKTIIYILMVTIGVMLFAALVSCAGNTSGIKLTPTSEGCIAVGTDQYKVAYCPNGDIITIWQQKQLDGSVIIAKAIKPKHGKVRLSYEQGGIFIAYDGSAKSPVTIGAIPKSENDL